VPDGAPNATPRRVDRAWRLLFGRPPAPEETAAALALVAEGGATGWHDLAHVLLATTEFVHVD
jgi:hypothetical protein